MLDFNSYISGLFGRRNDGGDTRRRLEGVIDTLTKQLGLLGGKGADRPTFKSTGTAGSGSVTADLSAIMDGESLKTGPAFDAGMDKLTGQMLLASQTKKDFSYHDKQLNGLPPAQTLFRAEATDKVASKISRQWRGFGKCVSKAMTLSEGQNSAAKDEILGLAKDGKMVEGVAKGYANWRQGGTAAADLGLDESLMHEIKDQLTPLGGENLAAAARRAAKWLEERLAKPEGPKGAEGQEEGQEGQDGQDGDSKDGDSKDGEGQDGQDGQDGDSKDGDSKDGEGQDGQDGAKDGDSKDGKDGEAKGKSLAERLADQAKDHRASPGKPGASGSFDPLKEIRNPLVEGTDVSDITASKPYDVHPRCRSLAAKMPLICKTVWSTPAEWHRLGRSRINEAKVKGDYADLVRSEKASIQRVADCIAFPARDKSVSEYGLRSGMIDEGNLSRLAAGISHQVFTRIDTIAKPRKLIVLLLDLSGSMSGQKIREASKICRLIIEAWKVLRIEGAILNVYGHTAEISGDNLNMVRFYDRTHDGSAWLSDSIREAPMVQNLDGFAIHAALTEAWRVNPDIQHTETTLLVVSDGEPAASIHAYHGETGMAHTQRVIRSHQRDGVVIEGIGICDAFDQSKADFMYGVGNCVILNDTLSGLPILQRRIKRICDR